MRDTRKRIAGLILSALTCLSVATFVGCGESRPALKDNPETSAVVYSNGGSVAKKGEYYYFINGKEERTANNDYGNVVKGALYRVKASALTDGKYDEKDEGECVVPALFVSGNFTDGGVYLSGDYVYYASPTSDKNRDGSIANDYLSFKKAKLNGSSNDEELKAKLLRVENNAVKYRFTEIDGTVYLVYADSSENKLYSFNTKTNETTLLVSNASEYWFDEDGKGTKIYYTLNTLDVDDSTGITSYNQVFAVRADAKAVLTNNGYKAKGNGYEKEYKFNLTKLSKTDGFDKNDYTTYPYVNLGELVLDGIGSNSTATPVSENYNWTKETSDYPNGYTYVILKHFDGKLLFSRSDSDARYLVEDSTLKSATSVSLNATLSGFTFDTNATGASIYLDDEYLYVSGNAVYKKPSDGSALKIATGSEPSLLFIDGDYLYYSDKGTNGRSLSRVNYTGTADDYGVFAVDEEYESVKLSFVDYDGDWYKPELIDNLLFYGNSSSYSDTAYHYLNVVDLNGASGVKTTAELKEVVGYYDEVLENIESYASKTNGENLHKALHQFFYTGNTDVYEELLAVASDYGYKENRFFNASNRADYTAFTSETGEQYHPYNKESYFTFRIGQMKASDEAEIVKTWKEKFFEWPAAPVVTKDKKLQTTLWIVGGVVGALLMATAIAVPIVVSKKKKAKLKQDYEATRIRKPKIDTTDDKSINVYEDENASQENTENKDE